jgi:hypothetical protein
VRLKAAMPAFALVAALLGVGCGELGADYKGTRAVPPPRVRSAELARYAPGAPQRALLEWCAAIQRGDNARVHRIGDERESRRPDYLARRLQAVVLFRAVDCPEIDDVQFRGDRATVFATVATARKAPNGRVDSYSRPQAFEFRRVNHAWRLSYDTDLSTLTPRTGFIAPPPRKRRTVERRDLDRYPQGTPERSALELLRALQHGSARSAITYFAPQWRLTVRKLRGYIGEGTGSFRDWEVPKILSVQRTGSRATLVTRLDGTPATLSLARGRGRWVLERLRYGHRLLPSPS